MGAMLLNPRHFRTDLLSSVALLAISLWAHLPANAAVNTSPELQQGIASYNVADHPKAVSHLNAHLSKNPSDAVAHYYLANSLLKLGQTENAMSEYRKAFESSKDPTLRKYCLQAIQHASDASATSANATQSTRTSAGSKPDSEVAKSMERIKQQIETAKSNKIRNGDSDAKDKITRGVHDVHQLEAERDMRIHNLLQPDAYSITGNPIYLDHTAEIEQLKRDYAARIKEAQALAKQEAEFKKAEVAKDANKMLGDVDNLRSQLMDTHHLPGTPALQATGTNFYTRQYGDPRSVAVKKPETYPEELLATPEKMLLDSRTKSGANKYRIVKEPLTAEQDKLKNHAPGTDLKVKGTLIKK